MKIYTRIGRRFVELQNAIGMYCQKDGTCKEKRDENTVGICVCQEVAKDDEKCIRKIALFDTLTAPWENCNAHCCGLDAVRIPVTDGRSIPFWAHMPTREEMWLAAPFIQHGLIPKGIYWTKDEYQPITSWFWGINFYDNINFGYNDPYCKYRNSFDVLPFVDIPIVI